jgi:predicted nuclease with TOPRIM domain
MTEKDQSVRKNISFGASERDQALLSAIETELHQKKYGSFSELCKAALHQFLLSRESTQSIILFIELERKIIELQAKFANMQEAEDNQIIERLKILDTQIEQLGDRLLQLEIHSGLIEEEVLSKTVTHREIDPLLERLGPLIEEF